MYLVVMAWAYVVLLMSLAEALSPQGTVLGALVTLVLYGVVPLSIVVYIMGWPSRRRMREQAESQAQTQATPATSSFQPDQGGHAAGAAQETAVTPVRKEP